MIFIISFSTVLLALYGFMIFYFWRGWSRRSESPINKVEDRNYVSVIIPFRNEEQSLPELLDDLYRQSYPAHLLEVIFINDHSEDSGSALIENFKVKAPFKVILVNNTAAGKKNALRDGMKHVSGDIILQTDADCRLSEDWVNSLMLSFADNISLVLGPVNMIARSGFWSAFAALDFMSLQASGAALALTGRPIMGSAANMAYKKELWDKAHTSGSSRESGDDVFLIQAAKAMKAGIAFNTSQKSIVKTSSPKSFNEMILQRSRWGAKTPSYTSVLAKGIALLVAIYSTWCMLLLGLGIYYRPALQLFIFMLGAKTVLDYFFLKSYGKATLQEELMRIFPSAALFYPFYIVMTLLTMLLGKSTWKGRTIR